MTRTAVLVFFLLTGFF